jgi:tyrosine-protein kinase Etk/Wzc
MAENRGLEFLDYVLLVLKWKKVLLVILLATAALSWLAIFLLVPEEFEATATIIPSEDASLGGLSALMRSVSALPLGVGGVRKSSSMDLYTTIIYSRTSIENVIDHFRLDSLYRYPDRETAIRGTRRMIMVDVTTENAYDIRVRARTPVLAADMTNYLVQLVNDKIVDLNVEKSRDNRLFLEQRYQEVQAELRTAEDSMKAFQEANGVFEAKEQVKATLEALTKLESDLAVKQIDMALIKKMYGEDSPQLRNARVTIAAFEAKLNDLKRGKDPESLLMSLDAIPEKALTYFRLYRTIEIGNKVLEYLIPMYEQAKFDEKKDTPILQVIDHAVPPAKKAYPMRTLMAGVISATSLLVTLIVIIVREHMRLSSNPRIAQVLGELRRTRRNPS